jgi:membrane protease YdiL (CAAX protease family)
VEPTPIFSLGVFVSAVFWLLAGALPGAARILTALLIGVLPAFAILQARMVAQTPLDEMPPRNQLYLGTIVALWGLAFATAFVAATSQFPPELLGVTLLRFSDFLLWFVFALAAAAAIVVAFKALGMQETREIHYLIPKTLTEKLTFVVLSVTAGICEELVFRGFLIAALRAATGSVVVAVIVSAAAFGAAHAHQNVTGGLRAALLGVVLTMPLLITGSLYPAIAAHAAVDLLGGLWLSKWLLKS